MAVSSGLGGLDFGGGARTPVAGGAVGGMGMGMGMGAAVGTPRPMAGQALGGGAPRTAQQNATKSGGGAFGDLDVFSM